MTLLRRSAFVLRRPGRLFASTIRSRSSTAAATTATVNPETENVYEGQRELRATLTKNKLMGEGSVDLKIDGASRVAMVTISNPNKKNALSGSMMMDLGRVTNELSSWRSGVGVVVKGDGDSFCSGADLNLVKGLANPGDGLRMSNYMNAVLSQFYRLPLISVALLRGNALGGGAEVATACDFRLMHPDARIGFVNSRLGVSTGFGGATRLVHLVGRRLALRLLLSAELIGAKEAEAMGLTDEVIASGSDPTQAAVDFVERLAAKKETNVLRTVKMISSISAEHDFAQALEIETLMFSKLWGREAHLEALGENVRHKE